MLGPCHTNGEKEAGITQLRGRISIRTRAGPMHSGTCFFLEQARFYFYIHWKNGQESLCDFFDLYRFGSKCKVWPQRPCDCEVRTWGDSARLHTAMWSSLGNLPLQPPALPPPSLCVRAGVTAGLNVSDGGVWPCSREDSGLEPHCFLLLWLLSVTCWAPWPLWACAGRTVLPRSLHSPADLIRLYAVCMTHNRCQSIRWQN